MRWASARFRRARTPTWEARTGRTVSGGSPGTVASGDHEVRHWHVDYLGGHPGSTLVAVVASPNVDVGERSSSARRGSLGDAECRVARRLCSSNASLPESGRRPFSVPVPRFGSSDCDCTAHLAFGDTDAETVLSAVVESFEGKE